MTTTKPRAKLQVLREAPPRYECRIICSPAVVDWLSGHFPESMWPMDVETVLVELTQAQIRELKRLLRTWEGES